MLVKACRQNNITSVSLCVCARLCVGSMKSILAILNPLTKETLNSYILNAHLLGSNFAGYQFYFCHPVLVIKTYEKNVPFYYINHQEINNYRILTLN